MSKDQEMISLVKDAVEDGLNGNLDPISALMAIHMILKPSVITQEDIDIAIKYNLHLDESAKF